MAKGAKMVMISYNEAMDDEIMEILEKCVMKNYTKIPGIFGKGGTSGTHLGTDVWPGKNNLLLVACDESQAAQMMECVRVLKGQLGNEGVKAFVWTLDEIT